ncbi:outer dense fiber protein 3-like protein 2b isoform X2 [Narcine bancroftii]|uniref:outer dense fiber protein 3-like protein 2b isoform X2 n=1 Tax=Narcine bancroftii TaxID=1343680 RepID=UPI0038322968
MQSRMYTHYRQCRVQITNQAVTFRGVYCLQNSWNGEVHLHCPKPDGKDFCHMSRTPGPGTYNPEGTPHFNEHRSPAYSMGSRTRYRKLDTVPAPNSYTLPSLMGPKVPNKPSSASFSVTGRTRREDLSNTPGPGRYNRTDPNVFLPKQPAYSMLGRHHLPTYYTQKPGPGAHSPEKVTINKPTVPAFSLGMRHSEFVTPLIIDITD